MTYIYPLFSAVLAYFKAHFKPSYPFRAIGLLDTSSPERPGMKLLVLKCLGMSFY